MGKSKPITIQGDVTKIVSLYENEALELEETEQLLKQFSKEDLIECLLGVELEEEVVEDIKENKRFDKDQVKSKATPIKKERVNEIEEDLDFEDNKEEDEDDLDL